MGHHWFILFTSVSVVCGARNADEPKSYSKKIVCFWSGRVENLSTQDVDPTLCTHLIYDGIFWATVLHATPNTSLAAFADLKKRSSDLKTLAKFEGSHFRCENYEDCPYEFGADERDKFIKNVISYLRRYNMDGLDLHWTLPVVNVSTSPTENYQQLIREFRNAFENEARISEKERLLLSISLPHSTEYIAKNCDFARLNKYLDFINVETFDYHYYGENITNHHAPLFALKATSTDPSDSRLNANHTIQFCIENGADRHKLILGIPAYGRCFKVATTKVDLKNPVKSTSFAECDVMTYSQICNYVRHFHKGFEEYNIYPKIMGPFAYSPSELVWVGYDDVDSVTLKAEYTNQHELGGIMFSSMDKDDFTGTCYNKRFPLIQAGRTELFKN